MCSSASTPLASAGPSALTASSPTTRAIVLRAADPIVGGRERLSAEGTLEQGASPDSMNNFQGRYAIRHAWEGAVECESPTRGIWGGPPAGTEAPTAAAATNLARVTRGQIALASTLVSPLPSLGVGSTTAPAEPEAAEAEAEPAGESEGPVTPTTDVAPGGCGCRVGTDGAPGALWLAALALAVLAARRRTA